MTRVETTTVMVEEAPSTPARVWRGFQRAQLRFPIVQIVLIFVVFAVGAGTLDGFGSFNSIRAMLVLAALVGIAATGQSLVILLGGFDLSVAGFMVAGALTVTQLSNHYGIGFGPAFVLMLVGAAILGGFVGWLCHRFTVQPLIITLAMGSIVVSLVQVQNDGQVSGAAPQWLSALSSPITPTLGFIPLPPIVFIWLGIALILWPFLRRTGPGRRLYFTGANERAAGLALVRTRWVWIAVFAFSAVMSSVAGVLLAGFAGNVNGTIGDPYLFQTLAVVIVGGTVFGGPGDYWRTVVGTLLLTLLSTVLIGQGFTTADRQILYGAVILMAMALYGREKRLSDRI